MKVASHVLMAPPLGIAYYASSGSLSGAFSCAAVSVLLDVDHFLDYCLAYPLKEATLSNIFDHRRWLKVKKIYIPFHSYELAPLVLTLCYGLGYPSLGVALFAGMLFHLLADQFLNRHFKIHPLAYFFTARAYRGFPNEPFFVYQPKRGHGPS
jgi:hypothetical protein